MHESEKWKWSRSVVSDSSRPHGLQPTRLLHPWDFPGKSTGVGCHCLLWNETKTSPKRKSWASFTDENRCKILSKVLSHFYNKHIDSCALWRRKESEVGKGVGGARGLSVSTASVNVPPGPSPAHTLQPSPCEQSISSPCGPERLCLHWQELAQERSKDSSNQLLSEDVLGPHSRASPLFSWESWQTVLPGSRAAEQTVSLHAQALFALGFWPFPILSHFLFQAAQSPWGYKVQNHCWFSGYGGGNAPSHPSHTLCFWDSLASPGREDLVPSCSDDGFSSDVMDIAPPASQEWADPSLRPISQTQGREDSGCFWQYTFPPPWQLNIPRESGVTEAEIHPPHVGVHLLVSLPHEPLTVNWVPPESHRLCLDFLVPAQVSRMTWQADPCSCPVLPASGPVPAVPSPRMVFFQHPHSSPMLTGLPRPLVWNNP